MRLPSILLLIALAWPPAAAAEPFMIELTLHGQKIEGMPLAWSEQTIHLLGRDGRLWEFPPAAAANARQTASRFRPYSTSELRAELLREMGSGFEVTGTDHYLVAHAAGQRDKWAERFEDLYRSFVHYFSVRGFKLQPPPTPLLGIVCRDHAEFTRYAAKQGVGSAAGVLGWYAPDSNRIIVYDMGDGPGANWKANAAVIIHEATHQTAFNTGVHSRWVRTPKWIAEGLATTFEAPGVYDSRNFAQRSDRLNRGRLADFQKLRPQHKPEWLAAIVGNDELFARNPVAAYAEAWALSFFLVETWPQKYTKYLALVASRPAFEEYPADERLADFTAVFGSDWRMLDAQFLRFMSGLK